MKLATIDYETRSKIDLPNTGVHVYVEDPYTHVLCMAHNLSGNPNDTELMWGQDGYEEPTKLLDHVKKGRPVEAHNANFELQVWNKICVDAYDWPELKLEQLYCSAAKSRACGLPGALGMAGMAMNLDIQKDKRGKQLLKLLTEPQKITKNQPFKWINDPALMDELGAYCITDVNTEMELSKSLPELSPKELRTWRLDIAINNRGVYIDVPGVDAALAMLNEYAEERNGELEFLTDGVITKATQAARVKDWCNANGYPMPNMQEKTVDDALNDPDLPENLKDILFIRAALARGSTGKYAAIRKRLSSGDRVRETIIYYKAHCVPGDTEVLTPTGWERLDRWTGGDIAQYDIDTKEIEFLPAERFKGDKEKDWVRVESNYLDIDMTYGHKVPTVKGGICAAELLDVEDKVRHMCSGTFVGGKGLPNTLDEIRLMVMIQADCNITNNGKAIRTGFKKERKIKRCKELLDRCGITYTNKVRNKFYLRQAACEPWMFKAKYYGPWLLDMNAEQREVFLEELMYWDGQFEKGSPGLASAIKKNVDWVQILFHLSNKRASKLSERIDPRTGKAIYSTRLLKRTNDHLTFRAHQISEVEDERITYCTITETGWWLARRNGKVFITGNTGRWGGSGIQTQNFPRPTMKIDPDKIVQAIKDGDVSDYTNPYIAGLNALRPMLMAPPGKTFSSADYSAVEARVLMWCADEQEALEIFRRGDCIYSDMASTIYNEPYETIYNGYKAEVHEYDVKRKFGKDTILGLGYQMGGPKFAATCASNGTPIELPFANKTVKIYRKKYQKVRRLWTEVNGAAIKAVRLKGEKVPCAGGKIVFYMWRHWLIARLPSGRKLYYPHAVLKRGQYDKPVLHYMTYKKNSYLNSTYGGKIVENVVSGIARDLLRDAMLRLDKHKFEIVLSVHDELVNEIPTKNSQKHHQEVERLMSIVPEWATGLPIDVSGWVGLRFRKG